MCLISGFKGESIPIFNRGTLPGFYRNNDWSFWCVRLPTRGKGYLPYVKDNLCVGLNGEIFNSKNWDVKYLHSKIKKYLQHFGSLEKAIFYLAKQLDGEFSFFIQYEDQVAICRDFPGTKPMFFWDSGFCSLPIKGISLPPGSLFSYNLNKIINWFEFKLYNKKQLNLYEFKKIFESSVKKRCIQNRVGILFSGGIDSSLVAYYASKFAKILCVSICKKNSKDYISAKTVAKEFGWDLIIEEPKIYPKIKYLVGNNLMHMEIGNIIYQASKILEENKIMIALSGQGADELFGGYAKYKHNKNLKEYDLYDMYFRNLERDDRCSMFVNVEVLYPFLDKKIVNFAKQYDDLGKSLLYKLGKKLGIPIFKKTAMQYGSGIHKEYLKRRKLV